MWAQLRVRGVVGRDGVSGRDRAGGQQGHRDDGDGEQTCDQPQSVADATQGAKIESSDAEGDTTPGSIVDA